MEPKSIDYGTSITTKDPLLPRNDIPLLRIIRNAQVKVRSIGQRMHTSHDWLEINRIRKIQLEVSLHSLRLTKETAWFSVHDVYVAVYQ